MEYDNRNTGVLFKNNYKEKDSHPDYKGSFEDANGQEKDLAAWIRTSKNGGKFLSVKVSDKWVAPNAEQPAQQATEFEDEVPF